MKSKIRFLSFLTVMTAVCILMLTGCVKKESGTEGGKQSSSEQAVMKLKQSELFTVEDKENINLADILQEKASGAMVQIKAGQLLGSGVIWSTDEEKMILLTAAHVLAEAEAVQVTFANGETVESTAPESACLNSATSGSAEPEKAAPESGVAEGRWSWREAEDCDLGIIHVPTAAISESVWEACCVAAVEKDAYDALAVGDTILVMGSKDGVAGNAYEGTLVDSWIYLEDYGQYMMLAQTHAEPGMSGGGVFQENGSMIGILSGADDQGKLAIVPLALILTALRAVEMGGM